ncbi:MAG: hypothetical protein QOJ83_1240, partial [Frankiales bacterium]|nr:hypothetical protein [Frankiales bacterium]
MTAVHPASSEDPVREPDLSALADPARVAAASLLVSAGPLSAATRRLVDLTASLLGTPYAHLSLLTDEQVIAVSHGFDPTPEQRVRPLGDTLCTRTAASGTLLAIESTAGRASLADLPPGVAGQVGSYIGVALSDEAGNVLGVLSASDRAPRRWSDADRTTLRTLAAAVRDELAARVAGPLLDPHGQGPALAAADIGSFELDAATRRLVADARFAAFFGFATNDTDQLGEYLSRIHDEDRERIVRELEEAIERRSDYLVEHRISLPDGGVRWLSVRGRVFADPLGQPTRMSGIAYDTTVLRHGRDQLARLLETMTDAFYRLDRQWTFSYVNPEAERILNRRKEELIGQWVWDAFPEAVGSQFQQQYELAVRAGVPVSFEDYFAPLDMWYEVRATPDADGLSVFFHDVSDRKRAEHQRELANGRLALLAEATSMMAATLDADVGLERLAALLVPSFADWVVISRLDEDGVLRPAGFRHHEGREEEMAEFVALNAGSLPDESLTGRVLSGGPPVLQRSMDETIVKVAAAGERFADLTAQLRDASFIVVPLIARGRVLGTIGLVATPPRWFTSEDLEVAGDLGRRAGLSLDNALLYAQARTAQVLA